VCCGRSSSPAGDDFRARHLRGRLGGIPAFGAIGIVVGPVVLSLVLELIEFAEEPPRPHGG
jgi:hypothetical protein